MARLSISTPTVIQTELKPLDDSFYIEADGQLEQWYYDNTAQYAPNHRITPLVLTPHLSAFDSDTQTSYSSDATGTAKLTFSSFAWYALEYDATQDKYVETEISNVIDGANVKYIKSSDNDGKLTVKANITYAHAVTLRCVVVYIDPRDSGITHTVQETVTLTTSRDATVVLPSVAMTNPSARSYNPLTDDSSEFEFNAVITNNPAMSEEQARTLAKYKVDGWGTEEILPDNSDGLATCVPTLDIDYPDGSGDYGAEFFYRPTANGEHLNMSGDAAITSIKGNTVSWNQLNTLEFFANRGTATRSNTIKNADDSYTVTATSSSDSYGFISGYYSTVAETLIVGHKYYYGASVKSVDAVSEFKLGNLNSSGNEYSNFAKSFSTKDTTNFTRMSFITANYVASNNYHWFAIYCYNSNNNSFIAKDLALVDLTLIYGAGNEPSTPEAFEADYEAWFGKPLTYEAYNAGELIPVKTTHIRSKGFNLLNLEGRTMVEKNYTPTTPVDFLDESLFIRAMASNGYGNYNNGSTIADYNITGNNIYAKTSTAGNSGAYGVTIPIRCTPNTDYFLSFTLTQGGSKSRIQFVRMKDKHYGTNSNMYANGIVNSGNADWLLLQFCPGESDTEATWSNVCLSLAHDGSRNGEYEESWIRKAKLNIASITGKLNGEGNSVKVFPDGLKKAGNVYDEVFLDGGVLKAIKRIGSVDMGTLSITVDGSSTNRNGWCYASISDKYNGVANAKCAIYAMGSGSFTWARVDSASTSTIYQTANSSYIYFKDTKITNSSEAKEILSGVILYYELAEPQEYILDPIQDFANFVWYGVHGGEEKRVDTLPYYVSGQETDTLKVDAMFGENINIVLRATKDSSTTELSPSKAFASVAWKIPEIDTYVQSLNGGAVRGDTTSMTFSTIVNVKGGDTLTEAKKTQHLRFNWKYRNSAGTNVSEQDAGWGNEVTIAASNLRHTIGSTNSLASTLVLAHVYLLGAWHPVTSASVPYNKPTTTKNGVTYERTIE